MTTQTPSREYIAGETRILEFSVSSTGGQTFTITSANWTLKDIGGQTISSGLLGITDHKLTAQIAFQTAGWFTLELTYTIGTETIKARYSIHVL